MAHPPHASAAATSDNQRPFESPHSEVTFARDAVRADGLNAIERSEREAAEGENRGEDAAIFERAASTLRPSWALAHEPVEASAELAAAPVATSGEAALSPAASVPSASLAAPTFAATSFPAMPGAPSSREITEAFPRQSVGDVLGGVLGTRRQKLIAAAVACVALGGLWAALSGSEEPASTATIAPQASAPAPSSAASTPRAAAPAAAPTPPAAPTAPAAVPAPTAKVAPAGDLTVEEASALLGLPAPPKASGKASAKPSAKPAFKAKKKSVAKRPAAKSALRR